MREAIAPRVRSRRRSGFGGLGWDELGRAAPTRWRVDAHRYFFLLHALDQPLGLDEGGFADDVHRAVEGHDLGTGTLTDTFAR